MSLMRSRRLRRWALIWGTGAVFQVSFALPQTGCARFYTASVLEGLNFCSILNCESSTYFELCGSTPFLVDCPTFVAETTEP
jgi:hypothetical protein